MGKTPQGRDKTQSSVNHPLVVHCKRGAFDVYVGRPSKWGNPFSHLNGTLAKFTVKNRDEAISQYRAWIMTQPDLIATAKVELKGKRLGCWCHPLPCHASVLAEIANSG